MLNRPEKKIRGIYHSKALRLDNFDDNLARSMDIPGSIYKGDYNTLKVDRSGIAHFSQLSMENKGKDVSG